MSDLAAIRARYKATKKARSLAASPRGAAIRKRQAKADARARQYIERWLAGETRQQIAESPSLHTSCVSAAITAYRKRHPDAKVPTGKELRAAPPPVEARKGDGHSPPCPSPTTVSHDRHECEVSHARS